MTKRFGSLQALGGVSLDVRAGDVQCLLGENGAGKSTLCNLIFGVYAAGRRRHDLRRRGRRRQRARPSALEQGIAMVHQHFSLVPRMTVVENLMLGQVKGVLKRHEFGARHPRHRRELRPHRSIPRPWSAISRSASASASRS